MACGKVGYASHDIAIQALYLMQSKCIAANKPVPVRTYYCNKCHRWHITSQPKEDFVEKLKKSRECGEANDFLAVMSQLLQRGI